MMDKEIVILISRRRRNWPVWGGVRNRSWRTVFI